MDKLDFIKQNKQLYTPKTEPEIIDIPAMRYLMYDGLGVPEGNPEFQKAFQALYGIAYTIKFLPKKGTTPEGYTDFKVPPPEGLWWMKNNQPFDESAGADWRWTLMLRMPDFVTNDLLDAVVEGLVAKKDDGIYRKVRLEKLDEGRVVQMMHIGPYEAEQASIAQMQAMAESKGYSFTGRHHEIYFGEPRRTAPEKLKTVLRHPVTAKN